MVIGLCRFGRVESEDALRVLQDWWAVHSTADPTMLSRSAESMSKLDTAKWPLSSQTTMAIFVDGLTLAREANLT